MSDQFDIKAERKLDTKPDRAVDVRGAEVITGTGRRRRSDDEKARILLESQQPGVVVSEVARRHGLSPQRLFSWRHSAHVTRAEHASATAGAGHGGDAPETPRWQPRSDAPKSDAAVPAFAAVVASAPAIAPLVALSTPNAPTGPLAPAAQSSPGMIEITLGDATVRVSGPVEAQLIAAVMRAVRRTS